MRCQAISSALQHLDAEKMESDKIESIRSDSPLHKNMKVDL
jgi:hypothetical protein